MKIEMLPISELTAYANNANKHSDAQITLLRKSMNEYGWTQPVLVDADNVVIAGHGRIEAAMREGIPAAPVIRLADLSEDQVRAYRLADNKLAEYAEWDRHLLASELESLLDVGFDLEMTGFDKKEMADLMVSMDDENAEIAETVDPIHQVVVECADEAEQERAYELLVAEGFKCRSLIL